MKTIIFPSLLVFITTIAAAQPGHPEWIEGRWLSGNDHIWVFERINNGDEGIITVYENDEIIEVWGWRWKGNETYHIKRYYNHYESFVVYVMGNNKFRLQSFRDANTSWVLTRLEKTLPELEESL